MSRLTHHSHYIKYDIHAGVDGFVYFAAAVEVRRVKVGWSREPRKRVAALNAESPVPLRLLHTLPGRVSHEKLWHELLDPWHVRGEWFALTQDSIQVLQDLLEHPLPPIARLYEQPGFFSEPRQSGEL